MDHPDIFFFPLTEPRPVEALGMEDGVLARRIPDFLCLCLNDRGGDRVGFMEMRAADQNGRPTGEWASFAEIPDPDEILSFLPENGVEAAVVGSLVSQPNALDVHLNIIRGNHTFEGAVANNSELEFSLELGDPAKSCLELANQLAGVLSLPPSGRVWEDFGTKDPTAFLHFLRGLDGAASLDPQAVNTKDPRMLLAPFVDALRCDPGFGLALRRLHATIAESLASFMLMPEDALELYDAAFRTEPMDSEALGIIGEFLVSMDETDRAEDWLQLAVDSDDPPAMALEALGIILANRGEIIPARNLWRTGARVDGHPDFFAHLARLAFGEEDYDEAWDKVLRGLRRISERSLHPGEWEDDEGRGGVLLRYLTDHLDDSSCKPPEDVIELLCDLTSQIVEPEDRLDLGICLHLVGRAEEARKAIRAALPHVEDLDRRDVGAYHLAESLFEGFDKQMTAAADSVSENGGDAMARAFLEAVVDEIPQYWPAWYYLGQLHESKHEWQAAYDAFHQSLVMRRDQAEIHAKCGVSAFAMRKIDLALEHMERAVELAPDDAGLHANHALILLRSGQPDDAAAALEVAETLDPEHEVVVEVRAILDAESEGAE